MIRLELQQRVRRSPLLQRAYTAACAAPARRAAGAGHPFHAAELLLHARKHVDPREFGRVNARFLDGLLTQALRREDGTLLPSAANALRRDFVVSKTAREARRRFASMPLADRVRLRLPRSHDDPERLGNLMILKRYDAATGEKGVLLVAFNYSILDLPAVFDLPALAQDYMFVLEPSWWGYEDARFFLYVGSDVDVVVEAQRLHDHDFVRSSDTNLVPLRLGAGDWGDPRTFSPRAGTTRTYDVAMVAGWDPFKRHEILFQTLERLRVERGRRLKVALVGYPMSWDRSHVDALVQRYGLEQDCDVFERIPHADVAGILCDSRMSVLLSRGEGANKAMYESFFCGTPVIVTRGHLGVNLDHVTPRSGRLASDEELGDAIVDLVDRPESLDPRGWALENTGWPVATRILEDALEAISARRGSPWTRGIVARMKAPGNRYAEPGQHEELAAEYDRIARYLLPT